MKIKILFDKDTKDKKLNTGWGISFLVDGRILFDAGENGSWLMENIRDLKVNIEKIEDVVISHDHWDHKGGLWKLLKEKSNIKVYACRNFSSNFKDRVKSYGSQLIETDKYTKIRKNIYTTGEIGGTYGGQYMPEQALVLKTPKGVTILAGCAHPGIIKIIGIIKQNISGSIYLVLGGFHLMGKRKTTIRPIIDKFRQFKVKKVAPSHCSGKNTIELFKKEYGNDFIEVKVGEIIQI